ncbi:MAG: hypothetical protein LBH52_00410 [Puniceicoccales bacterium]|nr:hypothetical protein [Puniceicoccales bacterium]
MFIFNLLLFPFRGLWSMLTGLLLSLPIWVIAALYTVNHWIPWVLNQWIYNKTGFQCNIERCELNIVQGEFTFKNIVLNNSRDFNSSDWIKIREIACRIPITKFFQKTLEFEQMTLDFRGFTCINEDTKNNMQQFVANFSRTLDISSQNTKSSLPRGVIIDELTVKLNGFVGFRYYSQNEIKSQESRVNKNYSFSNVCFNLPKEQQDNLLEFTSLETVYTKITASILTSVNSIPNGNFIQISK